MNRRTGLLLLVAIAVLGGIAYYINVNPDVAASPTATPGLAASESKPLWQFDPSQVTALTVADSATAVTFSASVDAAGKWTMSQPQVGEADSLTMSTAVNTLSSLTSTRDIEGVVNLTDFGLATPKYVIEIQLADGATLKAMVGDKAITGYTYYVLAQGASTPALVSSTSLDSILTLPAQPPLVTPTVSVTQDLLPTLPLPATATP